MSNQLIVGLCGTHGTGKTTILHAARDSGNRIDESQLSRTAQKMLGWDKLSRAQESIENMWALQDAIMAAMYDRDQAIIESGELTVVERTPADIWAYTEMWCTRLNISVYDERAYRYKQMCRVMAQNYARFVIVPPVEAISFVEEPNRADLASRKLVEEEINDFIIHGQLPYYVIGGISREARRAEINYELTIIKLQKGILNNDRRNQEEA